MTRATSPAMDAVRIIVGIGALTLLVWLFATAFGYNADRGELCAQSGLEFGRIFMGDYGCVEFHSFDEIEERL